MTEAVETFEHAGCRVRIFQDEDSESPREWTRLGEMVTFRNARDFAFDRVATEEELAAMAGGGWEGLVRHLERAGATCVLPVGALVHSGVHVYVASGVGRAAESASDPGGWDSGLAGWIMDTPEGREECRTPAELISECLAGEVESFDQWLQGDVYGYVVEASPAYRALFPADATEESCWGFYGIDDVTADAKRIAEADAACVARALELEESRYSRLVRLGADAAMLAVR